MIGAGQFFRLPRRVPDQDARVLPLINIVFLLLIFFLITGHMSAQGPFEMEPVQSATTGFPQLEELTVFMRADGRLALADGPLTADELEALIRMRRAETEAGIRVRLQADGRTEATRVVAVMERMRTAGMDRLELLTLPER